jgi:hypothetical protein
MLLRQSEALGGPSTVHVDFKLVAHHDATVPTDVDEGNVFDGGDPLLIQEGYELTARARA